MKWTRRAILGVAAALAGAGGAVYVSRIRDEETAGSGEEREFQDLLRRTVSDLKIPCNSARSFLSAEAGEGRGHDVRGLSVSLEDTLERIRSGDDEDHTGRWSGVEPGRMIHLLAKAVKEDFLEGDLCVVEGWQLSLTECRLAAFKLLLERDPKAEAVPACRKQPLRWIAPPPVLSEIVPTGTFVGVPFTPWRGKSVINVHGSDFEIDARILFGGVALDSSVGSSGWMNAYVPDDLYAREGTVEVTVENPDGAMSNAIEFAIVPGNE